MFSALDVIPPKYTPKSAFDTFQEKEERGTYRFPFYILVKHRFCKVLLFLFCCGLFFKYPSSGS